MQRVDIVGLTLAEVSLVILFAFIGLWIPTRSHHANVVEQQKTITELKKKVDVLQAEADASKAAVAQSRDPALRSKALPSCAEIGDTSDWLFTTVIEARDAYLINGVAENLEGIITAHQSEIAEAQSKGCIHRVQVYIGRDVTASDYDFALRRLEEHFYTKKLGLTSVRPN